MPVLSYAGATSAGGAGPQLPAPVALPPPPADLAPPATAVANIEEQARHDGRLLDRKAAVLVVAAIGLGGLMQLTAVALSRVTSIEPEALIRYDIVLTISMYAAVAVMMLSQITPSVRLRWGDGPLLTRIGIGAGAGVGFSLLLVALVSAAAGHLQSDPRIVLLMSEGDPTHVIVTAFIGCVAAPLVEETLFRGLLLESLLPRGKAVAIIASAGAFAVWHFMPASLIYYAALGAALAGLYIARGLACSMAAHVGFNVVLTVAAISIVMGPSHVVQVGDLSLTAPSGWSAQTLPVGVFPAGAQMLLGPDDAQLEVVPGRSVGELSIATIAQRLRSGVLPVPGGVKLEPGSLGEVHTPVGEVVDIGLTVQGRAGTLGFLTAGSQSYEFVFLSAGSDKARGDFDRMLASLRD